MLLRNLNSTGNSGANWSELSCGAPTIAAFADLCGQALSGAASSISELDDYANALLSLARNRGMFDLRGNPEAFDTSDRLLAICVEVDEDCRLLFRKKNAPRETMKFLDGFRQLCQSGLVIHHLQRDFSLTRQGFEIADTLAASAYTDLRNFAVEIEY
ncbi:MAG: hypothetical protein MK106_00145 [Mariniblastus sp.]|nr:hypothetical protein [Mariniblastus sp.]